MLNISLPAAQSRKIYRGTVQHQNLFPKEGLFHLQITSIQLHDDTQPFQMPSFKGECNLPSNLENFVEERLTQFMDSTYSLQYLVVSAHTADSRERLNLPKASMQADTQLLSTRKHFPGVHSFYTYISVTTGLLFSAHVEDFCLRSINIFYQGKPKIWIMVQPEHKDKLKAQIGKHLNLQRPKCSQFIRHQSVILPPSILRKWFIKFDLIVQSTLGDMVSTYPGEYHWGINVGANMAEAVNFSGPAWLVPPLYLGCSKRNGCGDQQHMTISDMEMSVYHELDVTDFEEPDPTVQKKRDCTISYSQRTRTQTKELSVISAKEGSDINADLDAKKTVASRKRSLRRKETPQNQPPPSEIAIRKSTRIEGSNLVRLEGKSDIGGEPTSHNINEEISWWIDFAVKHHNFFM